ncbi:MAG: crossover junction endodeoxyribonuclease RuvC [Candidatus Cloacimonetes bacterium]|nr:crossover junction endodeoxyribonuclease RuvC [Candidatus Cloacimonadota bacterium]
MIILGIDPGSYNCGYGILELSGRKIIAAGCDTIRANQKQILAERICVIYEGIKRVLIEYQPDVAAVEDIFYGKSIRVAFTLGHVRGAILLSIHRAGIPIVEYSPRSVKSAVVGNGNAHKQQVRYMVEKSLGIDMTGVSEDAADGLALALCHYNKIRMTL